MYLTVYANNMEPQHLCLPGVSGYVCVSSFLLPKEMKTIPGPPEFYLVCPMIAGLLGRREGGREVGRRGEWMVRDPCVSLYVSLYAFIHIEICLSLSIHLPLSTSFPRAPRTRVCVCV